MKANRSIVYRLYPNNQQKEWFIQTFGCCRKIHNLMLNDWQTSYKETGKTKFTSPAQYKGEYPYLRDTDSLALVLEWKYLKDAYNGFFNKRTGFPKFKSAKRDKKSYTTYSNRGTGIRIEHNEIHLPKIGFVTAKIHRLPKSNWKLKNATITMTSDGKFYASIMFEFDQIIPTPKIDTNKSIGLDYKSDGLYIDSNGAVASSHKYFRESQSKLAKLQQRLSHKVIGSNHYISLKKQIARLHKHIANQRKDFLQKLSTEIANLYDIVCVEDLDMKKISQAYRLGKSTTDNGYGMFIYMLSYKLAERGKSLIKIDRYYSSTQICSHCGNKYKLELSERIYSCIECGTKIDRDLNAAINIKNEGVRQFKELFGL